jgi:hypothetical protein
VNRLPLRHTALLGAVLAAVACGANAESTYGYAAAGAGTVTATARVNLSVTVPKLILLRVGSASTTVDTASWSVSASIPATPTAPVNGNNTGVNWYAWTNSTTPTINCSMGAWSQAGGPTNANFTVAVTGTLPHPGGNLGACASTAFPAGSLAQGTWQYSLGGTPGTWAAGVYTNTILYTAQGL